MSEQRRLVAIGRVAAPQGVRGAVRVQPLTDQPGRWQALRQVFVGEEPAPRSCRLQGFVRGGMPVLALAGVGDRMAAEGLRGLYLRVPLAEVPPLPEGEYYLFQLEGLAVVDPAGTALGRVVAVEPAPAADLLVVELPGGGLARVPLVRALVQAVDSGAGRVVVRPIPGLLEP